MEWEPLWLSLQVSLVATLSSLVLGVALGALLARPRLPGRDLWDALLTAPLVLPPTVLGYFLLVALGRHSALGQLFEQLFGGPIVFTFKGAVIAATVGSLPLVIKAARAALEQLDPALVFAARTLGASPTRAFWRIQLPLAARGIAAGAVLAFARALGDFGATLMVAGNIPHQTRTAALAIYDAIEAGRDADAAGMIAVLTALAIFVGYTAQRLVRRSDDL
ncbi:MAG: Molybdenum transport system permease protein ModB [Myxococcaceae bacterium]|nr:Molybdenum transport system permease protein ModB [Myxococcaceae bacterium]